MEKMLLAIAVAGAILATGCSSFAGRPPMGVKWAQENAEYMQKLEAQGFPQYSPPM